MRALPIIWKRTRRFDLLACLFVRSRSIAGIAVQPRHLIGEQLEEFAKDLMRQLAQQYLYLPEDVHCVLVHHSVGTVNLPYGCVYN